MSKRMTRWLFALFLAVSCFVMTTEHAAAADWYDWYEDWINDNGWDISDEENSEEDQTDDWYEGDTLEEDVSVFYGDKGTFATPGSWTDKSGVNVPIVSSKFSVYDLYENILTLDEQGNYEITGVGTTDAEGRFYDASGRLLLTRIYHISSRVDMSGVTLDRTSAKGYVQKGIYYASSQFEFRLVAADKPLPIDADDYEMDYSSSNTDMYVSAYMSADGTIMIDASGAGKTTVTLVINEKNFKVTLHVIEVGLNKYSLLLATQQSSQLKVSGIKETVKWSSSKPGVVKVTSDGKVKALKNGNAVIKAKVGGYTFGCAVSVVSSQRYKTIMQAVKIGKTCSYSQPNRMQKGYYDCSSLTWRAYQLSGITFGSAYYAPVAADQAKWLVQKKKSVKGGLSDENIQKMKLCAGDLMFEEGNDNGRYRNIYHVEMIRGYVCYGFDDRGKPILGIAWANRPDNNYWPCGQLVCRP